MILKYVCCSKGGRGLFLRICGWEGSKTDVDSRLYYNALSIFVFPFAQIKDGVQLVLVITFAPPPQDRSNSLETEIFSLVPPRSPSFPLSFLFLPATSSLVPLPPLLPPTSSLVPPTSLRWLQHLVFWIQRRGRRLLGMGTKNDGEKKFGEISGALRRRCDGRIY